ncbi:MAG: hypothetical protein HY554_08830 [Elusimicrobia bacterium]|nr:hypothetical protein [Elusimicrobiota bacterium]
MPEELRWTALQVVFVVNHDDPRLTKKYMGWSAEDDPDYRFPDTHFFPKECAGTEESGAPARKAGTIKVNFTEKFLRTLDFADNIRTSNPAAFAGARSFWRGAVAHELKHALQYHVKPVRDLASVDGSVRDGLADEALLRETRSKIEYEREAYALDSGFLEPEGMIRFAEAIESEEGTRPSRFEQGGDLRLLAADQPNSVPGRYMREEAEVQLKGEAFGDSWKRLYEGQYRPAELVWSLKRLNDALRQVDEAATALGFDRKEVLPEARARLESLRDDWKAFMERGKDSDSLKETYPYLTDVETRFHAELSRFDALSRR